MNERWPVHELEVGDGVPDGDVAPRRHVWKDTRVTPHLARIWALWGAGAQIRRQKCIELPVCGVV